LRPMQFRREAFAAGHGRRWSARIGSSTSWMASAFDEMRHLSRTGRARCGMSTTAGGPRLELKIVDEREARPTRRNRRFARPRPDQSRDYGKKIASVPETLWVRGRAPADKYFGSGGYTLLRAAATNMLKVSGMDVFSCRGRGRR